MDVLKRGANDAHTDVDAESGDATDIETGWKFQYSAPESGTSLFDNDNLLTASQLPPWYEPREHVEKGYRRPLLSSKAYFLSLFWLHNETGNIWTHLLGWFLWIYLSAEHAIEVYQKNESSGSTLAILVLCYFLCSLMPLMSVVAHAFACQSKRSWDLLWRLDYAAILILWFGGKVIYEGYFAFFCTPTLYYLWLGIALPVFLVLGYQFVVQDNYNSVCMLYLFMHVPNFFMSRVLADMSHAALLERAAMEELEEGLSWCWVGSACGVVGFMVFITRVPERWFPGYFTCWGISHQWWHVFVTLGPLCCLKAGRHFVHYTSMAHCSSSSSTTGYA